jgi:hypothetical protein
MTCATFPVSGFGVLDHLDHGAGAFASSTATTLVIIIVLRPLLLVVGFAKVFSRPSIAELSLGVTILGLLMLLF